MTHVAFDDYPPDQPHLTPYDERHLKTYLRLLDADEEGADTRGGFEPLDILARVDAALGHEMDV